MSQGLEGSPTSYVPPRLVVLGSVHELTQTQKTWGGNDGDWFVVNGSVITISNAS
jgi:hypothetical protein